MKKTIDFNDFYNEFKDYNRLDNFSHEGLKALFEWLEQYEEDAGDDIELDVIALCCDFEENDFQYFADNYKVDIEEIEDYLNDNTLVIPVDNDSCIIQCF